MKLYQYRHVNVDRPEWAPLQAIALRTAERHDLPTIDPGDFMWMCELESLDGGAALHLYKHIVTRRYLNLDTALRAYVFVDGDDDTSVWEATIYYRRLRSITTALARLDLERFDLVTGRVIESRTDDLLPNVVALRTQRLTRGGTVA